MCLDSLEKFKVKLNEGGVGTGYKIFKLEDGKLYGEFARIEKVRRTGVWLKEQNFRHPKGTCLRGIDNRYKYGWHIFLRKQSAYDWGIDEPYRVIRRIKFKDIVAKGRNVDGNRVVVAKEIFIPKEEK